MSELQIRGRSGPLRHRRRAMTAVDDVDLAVAGRRVVGLVGESGSGKSTLARAAVGLARSPADDPARRSRPVRATAAAAPTVQMVFQDPYASSTRG